MKINHRNVDFSTFCRSNVTRLPFSGRKIPPYSLLQKAILDTFGSDIAVRVPVPDKFINMPKETAKFADTMRSCIYPMAKERGYAAHGVISSDGRYIQMWVDIIKLKGKKSHKTVKVDDNDIMSF